MTRSKHEQEAYRKRDQMQRLGLVEYKKPKRAACGHMSTIFDRKTWVCMVCAIRKRKVKK